jgi:RES domain-containing protein
VILWRISNHIVLDGKGGLRWPGRWHTAGRRVVYCTQSPSAALLEILVHFEVAIGALPARYRLLKISVPDDPPIERLEVGALPDRWIEREDATQTIGNAWLAGGLSALLLVPSAIVPETTNVLINPLHASAAAIEVVGTSHHVIDPRLLR